MFSIFNNCVYNGLISLVGDIFTKVSEKHVASSTALTSTSISLGTVVFNYLGPNFQVKDEDGSFYTGFRNRFLMHAIWTFVVLIIFFVGTMRHEENFEQDQLKIKEPVAAASVSLHRQVSVTSVGNDLSFFKRKLFIIESVPDMLLNQKSLTIAFYCWMIATFVWSMTYTIPYSNAASWEAYRVSTEESKKELSRNMTIFGISELISRLLQICFAHFVPERKFSLAFSIFTFASSFSIGVLLLDSVTARLIFFIVFPLATGPLNGLLFGATQDIFGPRKILKFWPLVNVFLALGFCLGPLMASLMVDPVDKKICVILLILSAILMVIVHFQMKKNYDQAEFICQNSKKMKNNHAYRETGTCQSNIEMEGINLVFKDTTTNNNFNETKNENMRYDDDTRAEYKELPNNNETDIEGSLNDFL